MSELAGIWRRVSTGGQDEAKQDLDLSAWVTGHGYEVNRTYTVHGGSAHKRNRKFDRAWAEVLEDMRHGRITVLVAWKLDRLDRKLEAARMLRQVTEVGGRVEFVTQPYLNDLTTLAGKINLVLFEHLAYEESQVKSDRSKMDRADKRARGVLDGKPPWGFTSTGPKDHRVMVATAAGEKYIPEVFTRIADGHPLAAVAAWLSDAAGRSIHPRSIAEMIRNPAYRGEYRARRYDAEGRWTGEHGQTVHQCPALVTGELWRDANANLAARPSSRRGQRSDLDALAAGAAMLSGHAWCGNPGCDASGREHGPSPMCRSGNYYRCTGRGRQRRGCGTLVPVAAVDALMNEAMAGITAPVLRPVFHPATGHQVELDDIAQALRDLPARGLDEDAEDAERARLRAERARLAGLPATPAHTTYEPTGETYGERWLRSGQAERRAWLRDAGFDLYLCKPEHIDANIAPMAPGESLSRTDVYEDDRAGLVFQWTGDSDDGMARGQAAGDVDPAEAAA